METDLSFLSLETEFQYIIITSVFIDIQAQQGRTKPDIMAVFEFQDDLTTSSRHSVSTASNLWFRERCCI